MKRFTVAELFCGCGGFSRGFARTGQFDVVLGNDIKKAALRTFRHNHRVDGEEPQLLTGDIRTIPVHTFEEVLRRQGIHVGELDCLIGGPPCQGFSQMRRSEERKDAEIVKFKGYDQLDQDPRNDLVLRFLEIASVLRPKVIVIENVPQMLRHTYEGTPGGIRNAIQALLTDMRYTVNIQTINAADYGVPQLRERAFFVASRIGSLTFPDPTHINPDQVSLFSPVSRPWVTVADAISDLPPPAPGPKDVYGGGSLDQYLDVPLSPFVRDMRSTTVFPYNHLTRRYHAQIMRIIHEMRPGETWDSARERMQAHYNKLIMEWVEPGEEHEAAEKRLIRQGLINPTFAKRYYWSAYTRLAWNRPALTITANANFLGSGRFTHPEEHRGITMREAARLQTFDDDFCFITSEGDELDTANIGVGLDMIGEAVPPLLAAVLAHHIAAELEKISNSPERTDVPDLVAS